MILTNHSCSSPLTGVYNLTTFILHAALLGHPCGHCPIFLTAASRRSMDRISVPLWLIVLSDQLPVIGLVGYYLTNYLMGRGPLSKRLASLFGKLNRRTNAVLANLSVCCSPL